MNRSTPILVLLLCALLLVAAIGLSRSCSSTPELTLSNVAAPGPQRDDAAQGSRVDSALDGSADLPAGTLSGDERASASGAMARFRARLVDEDGQALPEVGVRAFALRDAQRLYMALHSLHRDPRAHVLGDARTDAQGRFDVPLPRDGLLVLNLFENDYVLERERNVYSGEERDVDVGDLRCTRSKTMRGRVLDRDTGAGIADARVRVYHRLGYIDGTTDVDGGFMIAGIGEKAHQVTARAATHDTKFLRFKDRKAGPIVLRLAKAKRGRLRLVDPGGKAIVGARVVEWSAFGREEKQDLVQGEPGTYLVRLDGGRHVIHAKGFGSVWLRYPKAQAKYTAVLTPLCRVRARLVGAGGEGLEDVRIEIERDRDQDSSRVLGPELGENSVRTGAGGRFSFEVIPGRYRAQACGETLSLLAQSSSGLRSDQRFVVPERSEAEFAFSDPALVARSVLVLDEQGRGIPDARAVVSYSGVRTEHECDARGQATFALRPKRLDACVVRVEAEGYGAVRVKTSDVLAAAKGPLSLRLSRGGRLAIRCTNSSGKPLRACPVAAWHMDGPASTAQVSPGREPAADFFGTSDSRGLVQARGLAPGRWRIRLVKHGGQFRHVPFSSDAPRALESSELVVRVQSGQTTVAIVRDRSLPKLRVRMQWLGRPVDRGVYRLVRASSSKSQEPKKGQQREQRQERWRRGFAHFADCEPGVHKLFVTPHGGFEHEHRVRVATHPAVQTQTIHLVGGSLELRSATRLTARFVLTRDGTESATIEMKDARLERVEPLPPGRYELRRKGEDSVLRSFEVSGTESQVVEV